MRPDVVYIDGQRVLPTCSNCHHWDCRLLCILHDRRVNSWEWCQNWEYEDRESAIATIRQAREARERAERERRRRR